DREPAPRRLGVLRLDQVRDLGAAAAQRAPVDLPDGAGPDDERLHDAYSAGIVLDSTRAPARPAAFATSPCTTAASHVRPNRCNVPSAMPPTAWYSKICRTGQRPGPSGSMVKVLDPAMGVPSR